MVAKFDEQREKSSLRSGGVTWANRPQGRRGSDGRVQRQDRVGSAHQVQ